MRGFDGQYGIFVIADRTPPGRQDLFDFGFEKWIGAVLENAVDR
jgi:hypothetical protein